MMITCCVCSRLLLVSVRGGRKIIHLEKFFMSFDSAPWVLNK